MQSEECAHLIVDALVQIPQHYVLVLVLLAQLVQHLEAGQHH